MDGPVPQSACSRCGAAFVCGMNAQQLNAQHAKCWCSALPHLEQIDPAATCLCPACLAQALAAQKRHMLAAAQMSGSGL